MPRRSDPVELEVDPLAVPRARSQACRKCGAQIAFDEPDDDELVRCEACGAVSIAVEPDPASTDEV